MLNLFIYGTLLSKDLWESIASGVYASDLASVNGYARKKVKGKNYPGLIEQSGSIVDGQIYYGISSEDFNKLDNYEGIEYVRAIISARLASGKIVECFTYMFKKEFLDRLTESDWLF